MRRSRGAIELFEGWNHGAIELFEGWNHGAIELFKAGTTVRLIRVNVVNEIVRTCTEWLNNKDLN